MENNFIKYAYICIVLLGSTEVYFLTSWDTHRRQCIPIVSMHGKWDFVYSGALEVEVGHVP